MGGGEIRIHASRGGMSIQMSVCCTLFHTNVGVCIIRKLPMAINEQLVWAADELGIRLESAGGITTWEAHPVLRHQRATRRIENSIRPVPGMDDVSGGCGCVSVADVDVRFPDGSLKRPDISIFCREPDEQDSAVTLLPEAVIEIISKGYEAKDTVIGVPFYISQGVRDIIVFDPITSHVVHIRGQERKEYELPVEITLLCGCICTV